MSIGKDVYLDSGIMMTHLEEFFPPSEQRPAFLSKETIELAALLDKLTVDATIFSNAAAIVPPDFSLFKDRRFVEHRSWFYGERLEQRGLSTENGRRAGAYGVSVASTNKPTLADFKGMKNQHIKRLIGSTYIRPGVWSIDWVISELFPRKEYLSEKSVLGCTAGVTASRTS